MSFLRDFGAPELLIILLLVILLFGVGRISKVAGELGKSLRSFKDGLAGKDDQKEEAKATEEKKEDPKEEK